jgi:hypothetical protein
MTRVSSIGTENKIPKHSPLGLCIYSLFSLMLVMWEVLLAPPGVH